MVPSPARVEIGPMNRRESRSPLSRPTSCPIFRQETPDIQRESDRGLATSCHLERADSILVKPTKARREYIQIVTISDVSIVGHWSLD